MAMQGPLHCLHTAASHVAGCQGILDALAPGLEVRHTVREDLLARAMAAGRLTGAVHDAAVAALLQAAGGSAAVLCTCSTLGPAAWSADAQSPVPVLRIDEPMARQAVAIGRRIAVTACLETTVGPTRALLEAVAAGEGRPLALQTVLVPDAWALFEAGDHEGYVDRIAAALRAVTGADAIVLAQASMAPAAERAGVSIPVLSSLRPGLAHAVELCRQRAL